MIVSVLSFGQGVFAQSFYWNSAAIRLGYQQTSPFAYERSDGSLVRVGAYHAPSITLGPVLDYRAYEFNQDASVGILAEPTFGFYLPLSVDYVFNILESIGVTYMVNVPAYLQFNYGNFSTTETAMERGVGIGVGVNYFLMGNAWYRSTESNDMNFEGAGLSGFLLSARLSYRYWSSNNKLRTINLSYSVGGTEQVRGQDFRRQMIGLSFAAFNY
ncbi:MAG: hypothetical protein ACK417_03245 [Bacteroidia bacterium]